MDLFDRYLERTVALLPRERREPAAAELRAELEERLGDRLGGRGPEVSGEDRRQAALEVLREAGPPEAAAARMSGPHEGLIPPHLAPSFRRAMVIGLALLATFGLAVPVASAWASADGPLELLVMVVAVLDDLVLALVVVLVALVGVFVLLDRTVEEGIRRRWEPETLLPGRGREEVRRGDVVVDLALTVAALVVLNVFPGVIGAFVDVDGESGFVPLLLPAVRAQLLWLDLWLVGVVLRDVALLLRGRWNVTLRWGDVVLALVAAWIVYRVSHGPTLLGVDPAWMTAHGWSTEAAGRFREVLSDDLESLARTALRIGVVGILAGAAIKTYRAIRATLVA